MDKELTFLGTDRLLHCNVCKEALEAFCPQGSYWKAENTTGSVHVNGKHMPKMQNIKKKNIGNWWQGIEVFALKKRK